MNKGFTGISFPFRIGNKGGVVLSTTNQYDVQHIMESIEQILLTHKGERVMDYEFGGDIDAHLFEPNDSAIKNLIAFEIAQILREHEPRIEVEEQDVTIFAEEEKVYAEIRFVVLQYRSDHLLRVEIGGDE